MNPKCKRSLSWLLVICLLLSAMVPAVFAQENEGVLNYSFTVDSKENQMAILTWNDSVSACTIYNDGNVAVPSYNAELSRPWEFAGRSLSGKTGSADGNRVTIKIGALTVFFSEKTGASCTNGDWIALKLIDIPAGTYKMTFTGDGANNTGLSDVFMIPASDYSAINTAYTSLTQENAETIRPEVNEGMKTLLSDKEPVGVFDSTIADSQTVGIYTCETAGDYILVFRCTAGQTEDNSRLSLVSLEMAPATAAEIVETLIANIGEVTEDSGAVIAAARAAYDNLDDEQKALVANYNVLTAAEEQYAQMKTLSYSFRTSAGQVSVRTWGDGGTYSEPDFGSSDPSLTLFASSLEWTFVGRSLSGQTGTADGTRVNIKSSGITVLFTEKNASSSTNGDWIALKLTDIPAGTYKMTFTGDGASNTGLSDVFMMPASDYAGVYETYMSLTEANAETVRPAVNESMKTLLAGKTPVGVFDSTTGEPQAVGIYTCQEAGDYILVFRCTAGQTDENNRLSLVKLDMTIPTAAELVEQLIAQIGEVTADSGAAIAAARAAYDKLDDTQKALVTNYNVLTAAEAQFAQLSKLSYLFKTTSGTVKVRTWGDGGTYTEPEFPELSLSSLSGQWTFVGRSLSGQTGTADGSRVNISTSETIVYFTEKNAQSSTNGDWIALKLADVPAGTYTLAFTAGSATGAGLSDVFMMPASDYAAVYADYMSLTEENAETVRPAVNAGMQTLLSGKEPVGVFDSTTAESQTVGIYTCENAGDYILVFRCTAGQTEDNSRLSLTALEMTLTTKADVVESLIAGIGEVTADSGAAIAAARNAYNKLDDEAKAQVANYNVLVAAEVAFAEMNKLSYQFKTTSGTVKVRTWGDGGTYIEPEFPELSLSSLSGQWTFVGRSLSGQTGTADGSRVNISTKVLTAYFTEQNALSSTNGDWIALKLANVPAGEFKLIMTGDGGAGTGLADVFMMPASDYAGIYETYMSLTEENAETVRPAVNEGMKTLLSGKEMVGVFNSAKTKTQTVGVYNCEEAGDYILVFRCSAGQTNENSRLSLVSLEMKYPTVLDQENAAQIDNQKYASLDAALAVVESGDTIVLYQDAAADELIVPESVTIDLNGYALTAGSVMVLGNIVDNSAENTGILKSSDITYLGEANSQLPLYDNAAEGYRFFEIAVESVVVTGKKTDARKYWFKLTIENMEAVSKLIGNGDSGLSISVDLLWDGQEQDAKATASDEFVAKWATKAIENPNTYIVVTVEDITDEMANFRLVPTISANGVNISGDELG